MNISFLNTSFLWTLPLAALPLLVHLFFRKNPRTIVFSDLTFIRKAFEQVRTGLRVRRYLLLLTRTLLLLLLVLFFARPVWHSFQSDISKKEAPASVVLVIDVSYSMGYRERGRTRLDEYKTAAQKMISLIPARHRIGVIAYSNRVESATPGLSNDRDYLMKTVGQLTLTARPTDTGVVWPTVQKMLEQAPGEKNFVLLLSDLALHGFKDSKPQLPSAVRLAAFAPAGGHNLWITGAQTAYDDVAQQWSCIAGYKTSEEYPSGSKPVSVYIGDKKTGGDLIAVEGNKEGNQAFSFPGSDIVLAGRIEAAPDNLGIDDTFFWAARRTPPPAVYLVDGDPLSGGITAESFYLHTVFPQASVVTEQETDKLKLQAPGVLILANLRAANAAAEQFIASGGNALIFLGNHYSGETVPSYFPATIGSLFTDRQRISWEIEGHPLASLLPVAQFETDKIIVDKGYVVQPLPQAKVLARLGSGWPFLIEKNYGKGKVILCVSTADREWNNLASRPLYTPLLKACAHYLSDATESSEQSLYRAGDTIRTPYVPGAAVFSPSGASQTVLRSGDELLCSGTEEPGLYRMVSQGNEVRQWAVNPDNSTGESDLTPMKAGDLSGFFDGRRVTFLKPDAWEKEFLALLAGKELSRPLLGIIALLLLAEALLSNPKTRREGESC